MIINYKAIVLFDGVCNFCNKSVQFIIRRDEKEYFHFASLQSDIGKKLIREYQISPTINSLVLIESGCFYTKSTAALRICGNLTGYWRFLKIFSVLPVVLRDFVYDIIAKNRYKWFGKTNVCSLPSPQMKKRFLE